MKNATTKILTVSLILSAASISAAATEDQQQVRAQMARFWGIAEQRIEQSPPPDAGAVRDDVVSTHSFESHRSPRTVKARQQASSSSSRGGVGLTLFGGLRIFDITWSDENSASNDDLQGNL